MVAELFRPNVGIVLVNEQHQVFWAKRSDKEAWQFPQGGIKAHETLQEALYRELSEEVGLLASQVKLLSEMPTWLEYYFAAPLQRGNKDYVGQRQKWFLLQSLVDDNFIDLNQATEPEFTDWRWVNFWQPLTEIVTFKKPVYQKVLQQFAEVLGSVQKFPV